MPVLLAGAIAVLRPIVLWVVQQGAVLVAWTVLDQVLNKLQEIIRDHYGISEEDATAVTANVLLDVVSYIGLGAAAIWLKIPLAVAKRLGLDPKKPTRRPVSPAAATKIAAVDKKPLVGGVKGKLGLLLKIAGGTAGFVWLTSALANIIEPGIYKPEQTNAVYRSLGIPFQYPTGAAAGTPGGFEPGEFTDYFRALETAGAFAISNPCKLQSVIFSREELAALVDCIYGQETAAGNPTTAAKLKPKLAPYIKTKTTPVFSSSPSSGSSSSSGGGVVSTPAPTVFTGVVTQGVLGNSTNFEARPDDLITDAADLEKALRNNLAPFLAALPGRVIYEVKIQASYTTKDGYTIRGASQKVPNGTYANGTPKFKSVTNKFAVANLYVLNDKNTRTKLTQIVLGPTDAIGFQPMQTDLTALETAVRETMTTSYQGAATSSKAKSSSGSSTSEGTGRMVQPKFVAKPEAQYIKIWLRYYKRDEEGIWRMVEKGNEISALNRGEIKYQTRDGIPGLPPVGNQAEIFWDDDAGGYYGEDGNNGTDVLRKIPYYPYADEGFDREKAKGGDISKPTKVIPKTLSEFFIIRALPLPTIEERGLSYEQYGLGPRGFYTGTAEQNQKLLDKFIMKEIL